MNATIPFSVPSGRIARLLLLTVLLIAAVLFSTSSTTIHAATIGVNFAPVSSGQTLPSGASAGIVPQTNWQNITSTTTSTTITSTILSDNTGAATTAALSVSAPSSFIGLGNYTTAANAVVGDEWLMDTNLAASGTMTFTITSIPYASYDLIIYDLPLFTGVKYTYTVGSTSYFGNSPTAGNTSAGYVDNNGGTPFTFTQATSTNTLSPTIGADYARFDGLSGGTLTFSVTGGNGISYINGFQIIESVPEPSRAMLLLGGLLSIAGGRTRRRL